MWQMRMERLPSNHVMTEQSCELLVSIVVHFTPHMLLPSVSLPSDQWYRQLCVLVWVLEAMRMESPSHMTPLSQCWRLDRPHPDEAKGKKRAEMIKTQLHKFDAITKEHRVSATPALHYGLYSKDANTHTHTHTHSHTQ